MLLVIFGQIIEWSKRNSPAPALFFSPYFAPSKLFNHEYQNQSRDSMDDLFQFNQNLKKKLGGSSTVKNLLFMFLPEILYPRNRFFSNCKLMSIIDDKRVLKHIKDHISSEGGSK